jgi:peroxiredoxin family protein
MSEYNGDIKKMMIILSKATLENVYAAFVLANGARMEGIEAEMFFTFFGLEAIHKKNWNTCTLQRLATLPCTCLPCWADCQAWKPSQPT